MVRLRHPELKELGDDLLGIVFFRIEGGAQIEVLEEEFFNLAAIGLDGGAETHQPLRAGANFWQRSYAGIMDAAGGGGDQVAYQVIEQAFEGLVELEFFEGVRIEAVDFAVKALEDGQAGADLFHPEQMGLVAVVEIGGVVGKLVGEINQLS